MCKITNFSVNNQEKSEKFHFSTENNFKIEANADAMSLSSYGGLWLLRQEESRLSISSQLASCIHDSRTPYLIRHSLMEIIMTRIFQICLGYEDVNVRISLKWYRCSGRMVPCGAEAWYRSYRSDGTGTKSPICTLSKGAVRKVPQGTLR